VYYLLLYHYYYTDIYTDLNTQKYCSIDKYGLLEYYIQKKAIHTLRVRAHTRIAKTNRVFDYSNMDIHDNIFQYSSYLRFVLILSMTAKIIPQKYKFQDIAILT